MDMIVKFLGISFKYPITIDIIVRFLHLYIFTDRLISSRFSAYISLGSKLAKSSIMSNYDLISPISRKRTTTISTGIMSSMDANSDFIAWYNTFFS